MAEVKDYRPLTEEMKTLANEGKELEERYLRYLDKLNARPDTDLRMVALARTNMQTTGMWAVRAIFQPERIDLPEDSDVQR